VRLAGGLSDDKMLDEATQARALACLHRFGERLRGLSPEAIRCVGTSALRRQNAEEFIPRRGRAPAPDRMSPPGSALIYLGVAHSLAASLDRRLVVDIGGGSTEFIIGTGLKPHERESLHMGCVNFSRQFFSGGVVDKAALTNATHELDWKLGLRHHVLLASPIWSSEPFLVFAHDRCIEPRRQTFSQR
jgi:exopolyphosphatase/guanosine-5'-triphosphate,3'-diphosphate pyrophosphatase